MHIRTNSPLVNDMDDASNFAYFGGMDTEKTQRADARRNALLVIEAAKTLFESKGVDVPMEEIGKAADVGKGTLYRHFPTRDHLLAAVSRDRFASLTTEAEALLSASGDPLSALTRWLRDFDASAQDYRGMRAAVSKGMADEGSALFIDCAPMRARAGTLLSRAQQSGQVYPDIEIAELLGLIAAIPDTQRKPRKTSASLEIILRGIAMMR